ncbi:unnamed protein product [Rotaria sordida]|uniref:Alpha/beta hydrolase fold-3 domain-containing protein n=1 Tax=Rotaria sordida TaxID=392033 RepID=A0A819BUT2_9BILA|nr:unnamed protein product [Rotaria sordida]
MQSSPPALTNENRVIETRKQAELVHAKMNEKLIPTFKGTLQEQMVNVNSTEIPITIYTPVDVNKTKLVIFFHGGGFTVCSRKTHQTIVNVLADATKTIWISVEYRRGPEHKFPIWWEDACEVTRHILENKESYGVESSAKVGLAGDSAGAALSASICHTLKNIDFQILVFGIFDMRRTTPSYKEFVHPMYFLTPEILTSSAFRDTNDLTDPRASVLLKPSFENLPPCLLIPAELDPLRDDSYAYQKVLDDAGVKTKMVLIKGVIHGYFSVPVSSIKQLIKTSEQVMYIFSIANQDKQADIELEDFENEGAQTAQRINTWVE